MMLPAVAGIVFIPACNHFCKKETTAKPEFGVCFPLQLIQNRYQDDETEFERCYYTLYLLTGQRLPVFDRKACLHQENKLRRFGAQRRRLHTTSVRNLSYR